MECTSITNFVWSSVYPKLIETGFPFMGNSPMSWLNISVDSDTLQSGDEIEFN